MAGKGQDCNPYRLAQKQEVKTMNEIIREIEKLKAEKHAVILAHNYVDGNIQDIADFCGDSLELSIKAKQVSAPVIVFCGVRFMAETAKLLSPESTVLLPRSDAGCPMADMADAETVADYKAAHPDTVLVAYVNSTAAAKASVDICCTSGNVEKVLRSIPADREIMFLPDRNLGKNMMNKLDREMALWEGCCPVHNLVTAEIIAEARKAHPGALVLIHPECQESVAAAADAALSTGGILKYVRESDAKEFVIGTEKGILHRLIRENPGKTFYPLLPEIICTDMKKISLTDVRDALRDMKEQIELPEELMQKAVRPIEAMLAL